MTGMPPTYDLRQKSALSDRERVCKSKDRVSEKKRGEGANGAIARLIERVIFEKWPPHVLRHCLRRRRGAAWMANRSRSRAMIGTRLPKKTAFCGGPISRGVFHTRTAIVSRGALM